MRAGILRSPSPLPGFGPSFGIMMAVLSIVVLLPIGALLGRGLMIGPADLWDMVNSRRIWAALTLSFRAALTASAFNLVFGLMLAWVLVRYRFRGRRFIDAAVDLAPASAASFFCRLTKGFSQAGGIRRTSWPSLPVSRPRKCAPPQASITTTQGGS